MVRTPIHGFEPGGYGNGCAATINGGKCGMAEFVPVHRETPPEIQAARTSAKAAMQASLTAANALAKSIEGLGEAVQRLTDVLRAEPFLAGPLADNSDPSD